MFYGYPFSPVIVMPSITKFCRKVYSPPMAWAKRLIKLPVLAGQAREHQATQPGRREKGRVIVLDFAVQLSFVIVSVIITTCQ